MVLKMISQILPPFSPVSTDSFPVTVNLSKWATPNAPPPPVKELKKQDPTHPLPVLPTKTQSPPTSTTSKTTSYKRVPTFKMLTFNWSASKTLLSNPSSKLPNRLFWTLMLMFRPLRHSWKTVYCLLGNLILPSNRLMTVECWDRLSWIWNSRLVSDSTMMYLFC